MRPNLRPVCFLAALALPGMAQEPDLRHQIADATAWTEQEVGDDVWLRQRRFELLFAGPQSITVLELRLAPPTARFDVAAHHGLQRTSLVAAKAHALAAINGGFYDTKNGNPVGLLRLDGELHNPANPDQGSLGIDPQGRLLLAARPAGDWPQTTDALGAGPMLLHAGKVIDHGARQRATRHPRSAIGLLPADRVLLVTVDGRTAQAAGMSLEELAEVLAALGCREALNLDGGGSSTLWVASRGICNFPCDNQTYDHLGERAVANSLLLFAPAVVVVDDDAAEFTGTGWEPRRDGAPFHGRDFAFAADGDGRSARFAAELPCSGRFRVLGRWPAVTARPAGRLRVTVGGTDRQVDPGNSSGWQVLGEVNADQTRLVEALLSGLPGQPLMVDAVRFVQQVQ